MHFLQKLNQLPRLERFVPVLLLGRCHPFHILFTIFSDRKQCAVIITCTSEMRDPPQPCF